jgi:hypothetical protein
LVVKPTRRTGLRTHRFRKIPTFSRASWTVSKKSDKKVTNACFWKAEIGVILTMAKGISDASGILSKVESAETGDWRRQIRRAKIYSARKTCFLEPTISQSFRPVGVPQHSL